MHTTSELVSSGVFFVASTLSNILSHLLDRGCVGSVEVDKQGGVRLHEFGNYLGTQEFAAVPIEVDEEYVEYLETLTLDELIEEVVVLKGLMEAYNRMEL